MRYAARRDGNEGELIDFARSLGAKLVMSPPLDWLLLHRGEWLPLEIKRPEVEGHADEFTAAQRRFLEFARAHGGKWLTWRTTADVLATLGARISA